MTTIDKSELIQKVLTRYGAKYNPTRNRWQPVKCIDTHAHSHGDSNPSASVNIQLGEYVCHACGLRGDGYGLLMKLEGVTFKEALDQLGKPIGDTGYII